MASQSSHLYRLSRSNTGLSADHQVCLMADLMRVDGYAVEIHNGGQEAPRAEFPQQGGGGLVGHDLWALYVARASAPSLPLYTVVADPDTGEWLGHPVPTGQWVVASQWAARVDTSEEHYDTYEDGDDSMSAETRAIAVRWRRIAVPAEVQDIVDEILTGPTHAHTQDLLDDLTYRSDVDLAEEVRRQWDSTYETACPELAVATVAVAAFRAQFFKAYAGANAGYTASKGALLLPAAHAQAVGHALASLAAGSPEAITMRFGMVAVERDRTGRIAVLGGDASEAYSDLGGFCKAYGLRQNAATDERDDEQVLSVSKPQFDAILAGLRFLQQAVAAKGLDGMGESIRAIYTDDGAHAGLSVEEIDALAESIN